MFYIEGFPGDVWVSDDNVYAERWISRISGVEKTKSQAQTIVTAKVDEAKTAWDNNNVDGETSAEKIIRLGSKPTDITLP